MANTLMEGIFRWGELDLQHQLLQKGAYNLQEISIKRQDV